MATAREQQRVAKRGGEGRNTHPDQQGHGRTGLRSRLTQRGQTTVPSGVRRALGLQPGEEIHYEVRGDVVLMRHAGSSEDPVVSRFLEFLTADMMENPGRLAPVTQNFASRLRAEAQGAAAADDELIAGLVAL